MKKIFLILLVLLVLPLICFARPPAIPHGLRFSGGVISTLYPMQLGVAVTSTGVEYEVLHVRAADDGKLGQITFECSVLTDGSEVCQWHFYVVSDTPGTLTEEFTIDVDSD